ncbi:uncharacterized protein LOC122320573 [Drosophila ficusphila]|uniref:uncharacterized protein LOC122320573 n=1 Tax=Drosophila ficusphila TaxID=30025 RepID=UPI001C8B0132|nr:uncharacterized protein LOC122320573 [Drosophila ficusphila]
MKGKPDLARGFVKGDRVAAEAKWADLAGALNAIKPPIKDVAGWKKVWCDWKSNTRKKIAKIKAEARATGGGPYSQQVITDVEEEVAKICGLYEMVEGVAGPTNGVSPTVNPDLEGEEEETPNQETVAEEPSRKRRRYSSATQRDLPSLCAAQLEVMSQMSNSMAEHFKRMEALQREDMELKRELLSKFNEIIKKLGE